MSVSQKSASDNEVNTVTRLLRGKFRPFRSVYSAFLSDQMLLKKTFKQLESK